MHRFSIRSSPVNHIQRSACCRLTQVCLLFGSILCFFTASILIFEQEVIKLLDLSYLVQIPHLISLHKTNMYVNVVSRMSVTFVHFLLVLFMFFSSCWGWGIGRGLHPTINRSIFTCCYVDVDTLDASEQNSFTLTPE